MRTLILHAGLPKCGSTSIQRSLHAARQLLETRGIVYWDILPNHSEPLNALSQRFFRHKLGPAQQNRFGSPERIEQRLRDCLSTPSEVTIISAEGMGNMKGSGNADTPGPGDARGRFRAAVLAAGFDRIRIIAYVRPPVAWWESMVQQRSKAKPLEAALHTRLSYRQMIEPVEALFPEAATALRMFDPAGFVGGSLLSDFVHAAEIPEDRFAGVAEVRANSSLSSEAVEFLDAMQRRAGREKAIGMWFIERYLRPHLDGGGRFRLSRDALTRLVEENREDIAWISGRLGRDVTPDLPPAEAPDHDEGREDRLAGLVLAMLEDMNRLRSAAAVREAQTSADRGREAQARRRAVRALAAWPGDPEAQALLKRLDETG